MDPLVAARRLPALADRAVRDTVVAALRSNRRPTFAELAQEALLRFERSVQLKAPDGVRPALLFAQRDRILRVMRTLSAAEITKRVFAVHRRDVIAAGASARPFDAIVRGRDGLLHAIVWRTLPKDGRRLDRLRAARAWARRGHRSGPVAKVIVIDLQTGRALALRVDGGSRHRRAA